MFSTDVTKDQIHCAISPRSPVVLLLIVSRFLDENEIPEETQGARKRRRPRYSWMPVGRSRI